MGNPQLLDYCQRAGEDGCAVPKTRQLSVALLVDTPNVSKFIYDFVTVGSSPSRYQNNPSYSSWVVRKGANVLVRPVSKLKGGGYFVTQVIFYQAYCLI